MSSISVVMGSKSDWPTVKETCAILDQFDVVHKKKIISTHRVPNEIFAFAQDTIDNGIKIMIVCVGEATHLPGMIAANTPLPVTGTPKRTKALGGVGSLLSIVQMPVGVPMATTTIEKTGAKNATLLTLQILGITDKHIQQQIIEYWQAIHDQAKEGGQCLG